MPKVNLNYRVFPEDIEEFYDRQERMQITEPRRSKISGDEWMLTGRYQARRRHKRQRTAHRIRRHRNY